MDLAMRRPPGFFMRERLYIAAELNCNPGQK
jgi:hypothetical protein